MCSIFGKLRRVCVGEYSENALLGIGVYDSMRNDILFQHSTLNKIKTASCVYPLKCVSLRFFDCSINVDFIDTCKNKIP